MLSSLSAASLVFLVSRGRIFAKTAGARPDGTAPARLAAYLAYTAVQVTMVSLAIGALARPIAGALGLAGFGAAATLAALAAKVILTPAQLTLNFLVAGRLNSAEPARAEPAHA
ncbi:MAG: hypothetical protein P4L73_15500 [Caulobacteraceae bacterium]|nr:hypothetical protein [Caulobacteraceae bacterium]